MRALILFGLLSSSAFAQSAFEGTWKMSLANATVDSLNTYSVDGGIFECRSCVPRLSIKADGQDHPVKGSPYFNSASVKLTGDNTVEERRTKNGKLFASSKFVVSDDGKTLTTEWSNVSEDGKVTSGKYYEERVGEAPEGVGRISGTWKLSKVDSASDSATTFTFKLGNGGLSMTDLTGDSYTAKFDGKKYPYLGDPGITDVSLKKLGDDVIEETDFRKAKIVSVARMTVAADGKTMQIEIDDQLHQAKSTWSADKQ
jgi:hypothetical protein